MKFIEEANQCTWIYECNFIT